jgi:putative transposase
LGYNLIRSKAAAAAMLHDVQPREISFTSTVQFVLAEWSLLAKQWITTTQMMEFAETMLQAISRCTVGNRPGRIEPRVLKRRPKPYKRMTKPRNDLRKMLRNSQ